MKITAIFSTLFLWANVLALAPSVLASAADGWGYTNAPANVQTDIESSIMNITNWTLGIISMICVLVILYGMVSDAKTIAYGLIGLVICGLAYAMVIVVSSVIL